MAEDRMKTILRHLSAPHDAMHAFGIQNPVKVFRSDNSETQKTSIYNNRYTNRGGKLTNEQKSFYEQNGFVVIPNLVSEEGLERYRQRFQDICEKRVIIPGLTVMREKSFVNQNRSENIIYKLQELIYDEVLFDYCKLPQILELVESFCGPNIKAVHTMLINKPPDSGSRSSRHPLHQDLHYFPFRPADRIVCAWTAMEKVTRENGCLVAIPGSHRGELLTHGYPDWEGGVNILTHGISNADKHTDNRVYLNMEAGDTVLFHPLLIHGSGRNRTNGFRKAISCHYAASDCYYIDVRGTSQQAVSDEVLGVVKKFGVELDDISVIWKYRSRLVQGKEGTL